MESGLRRGVPTLTGAILAAVALLAAFAVAPAHAVKAKPAPKVSPTSTGYWHVIGKEWKTPPRWFTVDQVEGGTAAKLIRHSGYCDMWETHAKVRADHAPFSSTVDIYWETNTHYEAAVVRDYYQRYQRITPLCGDFNAKVTNYKKHDVLSGIACTPDAASRGLRPATFCLLAQQPTTLAVSKSEADAIRKETDRALWSCGDNSKRIVIPNLDYDFGSGNVRTFYTSIGRVQKVDDYNNFGIHRIRAIPTARSYETAYGLYMFGGRKTSAIHARPDILCPTAGPPASSVHGLLPAAESDWALREFCTVAGDSTPAHPRHDPGPGVSNDKLSIKTNVYAAILTVATQAGWSDYRGNDEGYWCVRGSTCWSVVKAVLEQTKSCAS